MVRFKFLAIVFLLGILRSTVMHAQYTDGMTGLLHMPTAEMQTQSTVMVGGNYLSYKQVPFIFASDYHYNTFNYFINITVFPWLEVSYVCTLNKGIPNHPYWPESTWGKFTNQDRHFSGKLRLVSEGSYWKHMPSIVVGVSDPTTGDSDQDFSSFETGNMGNAWFNYWYLALTKHFDFKAGSLGVHLAYLFNDRKVNPINGPAIGVNFRPNFHRNLNLIAEYDARSFNVGATYSLWADHFNLLFELQEGKYISAGLVYKIKLKGGNRWNSKLFDY